MTPDFQAWGHADATRHRAVPARDNSGRLWLLADRNADLLLLQAVELQAGQPVRWQRCDGAQLDAWLTEGAKTFRALDGVKQGAGDEAPGARSPPLPPAGETRSDSPAVQLLDALIHDALKDGASDIHIENHARGADVRLRIDGVLLAVRRVDGSALAEQMVSRLKVMAELDIGERRLPQDGRFKLRVGAGRVNQQQTTATRTREVDFRVSVMPAVFGEDAVIRVLDRAAVERDGGGLSLAGLGFEPALRNTLLAIARRPHGMLLVTGPTGSGKTTTLYATIAETHSAREKLITIEDPVEYQLPGAVQIPVNEKKGLTFARGLRSVLRHDPDRVMVGEIRDAETAQIAVQAALTGHLVFSTVHANSALDVIGRFMHMGLDLYNVVGALQAVLAQRLLRQRCTACGGSGCQDCRGTGYRGRRAVAELLLLDDRLRDLIVARAPLSQIKQAARDAGMAPLREAALAAVAAGWTTAEELDRVTADV